MTGNEVALDTNQAVALLNDDPVAIAFYSSFQKFSLPTPVLGELVFGALNSNRVPENLANIDRLVMRCHVLDVTRRTAVEYASVRLQLKLAGRPIPPNDIWIGAICREQSIQLATTDAHFAFIEGLQVIMPP
jgi:tRNA(fMet)-specific endonuclease VapC